MKGEQKLINRHGIKKRKEMEQEECEMENEISGNNKKREDKCSRKSN